MNGRTNVTVVLITLVLDIYDSYLSRPAEAKGARLLVALFDWLQQPSINCRLCGGSRGVAAFKTPGRSLLGSTAPWPQTAGMNLVVPNPVIVVRDGIRHFPVLADFSHLDLAFE